MLVLVSYPWENLTWAESYFWAAAAALAMLAVFSFFGKEGKRGVLGMVIGKDNRWSTSRFTATMWTVAVMWVILAILFRTQALGDVTVPDQIAIVLGIPLAGAVGARASNAGRKLTLGKVTDSSREKSKVKDAQASPGGLVTDDEGEISLLDSQYFLFSLVLLAWFVTAFVARSGAGIPALPDSLLGLSSASGAAYLAKKGLERVDVRPAPAEPAATDVKERDGVAFVVGAVDLK